MNVVARFLLALALTLALTLSISGCGECSPHAAYTIPSHWDQAYYSSESYFVGYTYYTSCSYPYYNGYSHRTCTQNSTPHYRYYQQYHPAVYHPTEYVPAVTCAKNGSK